MGKEWSVEQIEQVNHGYQDLRDGLNIRGIMTLDGAFAGTRPVIGT